MEREFMEFDVVIVGAGPAGLATACKLMQLSKEQEKNISVCVVEKGSEVGAHILSGAIFEPKALTELFPDWKEKKAPLNTPVSHDEIYLLNSATEAKKLANKWVPKTLHNDGNFIISLGNLCRWLAQQAEDLGVEIFPGFAASELLHHKDGSIKGILIGDMGLGADGQPKDSHMPGMELHAKYTVFAEGCRGHLGKQLIAQYHLDNNASEQHYALGFKELWTVPKDIHQPGKVVHTAGWPLEEGASGGGFVYHLEDQQVAVGLIIDLNYQNPHLSLFEEFQRYKTHPVIAANLQGGERISYGARALTKGGIQALPKMHFPGGLIIGCNAGTLNSAKIKGSHCAIKSGIIAAETITQALCKDDDQTNELTEYQSAFKQSWLYDELYRARNFTPAIHKYGVFWGGAFNYLEQNWFNGKLPLTLKDKASDYSQLAPLDHFSQIDYPKADGKLTFDKLSSVFLANTFHEEDQPCHLKLSNANIPIEVNLPKFGEPAQRYCPAGVYEVVNNSGQAEFVINSQNCIHCKTCDIKDPSQNITWYTPEGGSGPNYPNM